MRARSPTICAEFQTAMALAVSAADPGLMEGEEAQWEEVVGPLP